MQNLPANATDLERTFSLLQGTLGMEEPGRIMQAIAPLAIGRSRTAQAFRGQGDQNLQGQQPQTSTDGGEQPQKGKYGGFFPRILTPQEVNDYAANYAQIYPEDPTAYSRGQEIKREENKNAEASYNKFIGEAQSQIPGFANHPERTPILRQIFSENRNLDDPAEIIKKSAEKYGEVSNLLDVIDDANVPGFLPGLVKKGAKAASYAGLIPSFMTGGKARDDAIKRLHPTVKELVDRGYEPYVRSKLEQNYDMSPTEVSEVIRPLPDSTISHLNAFPDSSKIPKDQQINKLEDFFKNNIDKDTSLLALRHRLWNDKGYNWEEIGPAIRRSGVKLNDRQKTEMATIDQDPPIQSMSDIFRGWGRWIDYIRGAK